MPIATPPLGRNGPPVSAIGYGAMSLGGVYGQKDTPEEKLQVLDRAWEIGERFWDTADVYFDSEQRIGEWFRRSGHRDDIFLATKFAFTQDANGALAIRNDPAYVHEACAKSLEKLGVDAIDLYYLHRSDGKTPIETAVKAMAELKEQGKIRHLGLCELSADSIRRAHAVHPITAVQCEYSLFCLDAERVAVLDTCRELGIALVAYSPVGRGLLTGQIRSVDDMAPDDFRRLTPKYSRENFPTILALVATVEAVAARRGCTAAQVCLAWLRAQGAVPIPGTRTVKYLEENTAAADVVLSAADVLELRQAAEKTELPGSRYPGGMSMALFADTPPL